MAGSPTWSNHSRNLHRAYLCGAAFRFVLTKSGFFSVPLFLAGGTIFAILPRS